MTRQVFYRESTVRGWVHEMMRSMASDGWRPDYVVGLTRGGLVPALMISQYLDITMHSLNVSLRDSEMGPESNLWMAEDAFGYDSNPETTIKSNADLSNGVILFLNALEEF